MIHATLPLPQPARWTPACNESLKGLCTIPLRKDRREPQARTACAAAMDAIEMVLQERFPGELGERLAALRRNPAFARETLGNDAASAVSAAAGDLTDAPLRDLTPNARMRALAEVFYRRQRQTSWMVGLGLSAVLLIAIAAFVTIVVAANGEPAGEPGDTQIAAQGWQLPTLHFAIAPPAQAAPVTAPGKQALLFARGTAAVSQFPVLKTIAAKAGAAVPLADSLEGGDARYVLLRGLPAEARLTAGEQTPSGSWIVSSWELPALKAELGATAAGDYPLEVYALGANQGLPIRQRLLLRIAAYVP